ncbi:hypothetical protein EZV62_006848 [Acer yangbiense]|uniref:Uncharacterized protein n=1 Tax=Acer yangbiense TaxID=1000413 RepID=A0A5C7I7L8_9ROSI|nr:hypothetical protein EZV62_006848 [Acer yangbiense]
MVDAIVSFALNRLTDFLIAEAAFLGRVRKEVQWLKDELEWMQCYIASAEEKQDDNPIVRKWLNDITKIAYDAEDVLDKFILQVHDQDTNKETKPTGCFTSMSSCLNLHKKATILHDIGNDIEELKIRINDLIRKRELYQLESSSNRGEGNSSNSLATLRQLRRTASFSVEKNVVGHDDGTTRLLANLLNQDRRRFVVSIYGMGGLGKTTLAGKLYCHLDVKSKFDCRAWVCVSQDYNTRDFLLRIISSFGFTTKKTEELKQMNEDELERYLHESLQGRSYLLVADDIWKKEAWLSFKRAFPDCNNGSRVIITTRSQEVAENSDERTYACPQTSLFPEDFEINVDQLIRLWVAEGFVPQDENRNMEDVAKDNFHELISRSLIQIGKINWGRVATCRVHDLLRELAIEKARELNLLCIFDQMKHSTGNSSVTSSCRREALYYPTENCLWLRQFNPSLRSLLSFHSYGHGWEIKRKITDRYTEFRESNIKYLPRSILNLRRLQTLDLFTSESFVTLPSEISNLQELRYLFGVFWGNLEIDSLTKLQSLKYVSGQSWISINTEKLGNLRELWINGSVQITEEFRFDSIAKLERLEQLVVKGLRNACFASLQSLTHCSRHMDLRLYGKIEKLPEDIHNVLPNLECLLLEDSYLEDDSMPLLEKLNSLMILFCSAQGFRRLEILKLDVKDDLLEWQVEEEAMPMLRGLSIPNDSSLRIPERFKSIPPPAECPLMACNESGNKSVGNLFSEDLSCLKWLDQQPTQSVIYVAFGTSATFDQTQFEEFATGLELSNRPFLWVVRPDIMNNLNGSFLEEFRDRVDTRGHIISWAPQQKVLKHPSIACFFIHCGWNSTIEALSNGVPLMYWPFMFDQFHNQNYICNV